MFASQLRRSPAGDLRGAAVAAAQCAFYVALEVQRGVLAGPEVGVGAAGVRVTGGPGVVGLAVVGLPHAGEVPLETVEEVAHHAVRRRSLVGGEAVARAQAGARGSAGQGDQDPRLAR